MLADSARRAIFWAADAVFGPWTIALLFGTGIFLTFRLRFVQVVRFGEAVRAMAPAAETGARGALSPFQSFMTALGASIGTGNIAGVATAVVSGGPGAVFWCTMLWHCARPMETWRPGLADSMFWRSRSSPEPGSRRPHRL